MINENIDKSINCRLNTAFQKRGGFAQSLSSGLFAPDLKLPPHPLNHNIFCTFFHFHMGTDHSCRPFYLRLALLAICQEPFMKHNNALWNLFVER